MMERDFDDIGRATPAESDPSEECLAPPTSIHAVRAVNSHVRFARYLKDFDAEAGHEAIVLCTLPAKIVDDSSRAQMLAAGVEKEDDAMQHKNDLIHIDFLKRNRLKEMELLRKSRRQAMLQNLRAIEAMRKQTNDLLTQYYTHAERELLIHLTSRQGEVAQSIGEIRRYNRGEYDADMPDWDEYEQQVEIRVCHIKGLKDKVKAGDYSVLVSKWDKLAGEPLRWTHRDVNDKPPPACPLHGSTTPSHIRYNCEVCMGWAGCTMKSTHDTQIPKCFKLDFDSRLFTFFLPQKKVRPYNCLIFELIRMPDAKKAFSVAEDPRPQVVGWSAIPIVDSGFNVINGRFGFPMLRGPYKPQFGSYMDMQAAINSNLENWLGNIYVEIFPHAREFFGRNEFGLQNAFTTTLLNLSHYASAKDPEGWPSDGRKRGASTDMTDSKMITLMGGAQINVEAVAGFEDDFPYVRPERVQDMGSAAATRWHLIRLAIKERYLQARRKQQEMAKEAVKRLEQAKRFRYAIHPYGTTNFESTWRIQVEYCIRAIVDELSLKNPLTMKFWINIFIFFTAFYFQLFVHQACVYFVLDQLDIPVESAVPTALGVQITYSHANTSPLEEVLLVAVSQLSTYLLLLTEIMCGWFFKKTTGLIPEQLSRVVFCSSLSAIGIPIFEIVVDAASNTSRSDIFRLTKYMELHKYGQYFTAVAFFVIFAACFAGCVVSTFLFTMALHLNGILQDAYWRIIVVDERTCHIPGDLEVSEVELSHILSMAERWRGKNGERRKIAVEKIVTLDDDDDEWQGQEDLHITIHQLDCGDSASWLQDKPSFVYREFYVLASGAIMEAVGDKDRPAGMAVSLHHATKLKAADKLGMSTMGASIMHRDSTMVMEESSRFFADEPPDVKRRKGASF